MRSILLRKDVAAWCLYDWANSAFVTSVTTVLLPLYYLSLFEDPKSVELTVLGRSWHTSGMALWAYTGGFYMLAVALAAPVLGAMADAVRGKKKFLAGCVLIGAVATAALAGPGPGRFGLVSALYIVAAFLWCAANIFYDGFLPELTDRPEQMDRISIAGYGVGYLGGGLMLAGNLVLVSHPALLGLADAGVATRACFVLVAVWWALFTLPLLKAVREGHGSAGGGGGGLLRAGLARLAGTLRKVGRLPELARFLAAFLLFNSGVGTIIVVAAAYGKDQLHLGDGTIIGCLLMVQLVGLPAAFGYAWLARRIGAKSAVAAGLVVYMAVVVYAIWIDSAAEFWVLALAIALVQGGVQGLARSLFGSMIPAGATAEFFGFFSVFEKVGPFAGPLVFGLVRDLTMSSRSAILFLIVFFVLGLGLLLTVRVERGREQARAFVVKSR